jgi:hypothetical protein
MTHSEAIAALRLLVDRADATTPSERQGTKWPVYTETEVVAAQEALAVIETGQTERVSEFERLLRVELLTHLADHDLKLDILDLNLARLLPRLRDELARVARALSEQIAGRDGSDAALVRGNREAT